MSCSVAFRRFILAYAPMCKNESVRKADRNVMSKKLRIGQKIIKELRTRKRGSKSDNCFLKKFKLKQHDFFAQ